MMPEQKTALVTGGMGGLGEAIARAFHDAGIRVLVTHARDEGPAKEWLAAERDKGYGFTSYDVNVADFKSCQRMAERLHADGHQVDILVNNAGMQHRTPLEDFPADAFERLLQTNVASVFHAGQAAARHMIGRGRGKIINIASVQTALARPGIAPYTATKGAVGNLTKGMATDWAKYGLQCNAIAPGYFDTPLNAALVADETFSAWLEKRTPAGRWGKVEELVGACIFLSSDASSFVNGHILYVDGGITASL